MEKSIIGVAVFSMVGCSSNMSLVPDKNELEGFSSPSEFMAASLDFDMTGLGLIEHPHDEKIRPYIKEVYGEKIGNDIIFFRSYFTKANDTHLYKPLVNAKAYCEYQGGSLNLVSLDSTKALFKIDANGVGFYKKLKIEGLGYQRESFVDLAHDAWLAGAFGMHECVTDSNSWLVSIFPYHFSHKDGSSDAHTADILVYVGE
ncbi:hypothetical protein [Vibrio hepatarius]|uniref:hypothetical protein n=1 Tax=Vibrio hepatarius TaxID=171383 RepID=UPI00148E2F77|nr:hypothetical protein [Vibrio hepatarius]NOI16508.1 hypothetical protein [Vibrio hepatarius]